MEESSHRLEDLSGNVTYAGSNIMSTKIKSNYAPAVDITVFLKFHTVWIPKATSFFIEKKDGNLIKKFNNGKIKNTNNNREIENINMKDVKKVIYFINVEQSIFDTV